MILRSPVRELCDVGSGFFKRNVELEIMLPQKFSGCSIVGFYQCIVITVLTLPVLADLKLCLNPKAG